MIRVSVWILQDLRNTHGTALFLVGADVMTVVESMRHSDPRLSMKIYSDAMKFRGPVANLPRHSQTPTKVSAICHDIAYTFPHHLPVVAEPFQ